MKLNSRQIESVVPVLYKLSQFDFPITLSYGISKNLEMLKKETDLFYQERSKLLRKYGKKDEDGQLIVEDGKIEFEEGKGQLFFAEEEKLYQITANLPIYLLNLDDLMNSNAMLSANDLQHLSVLVQDPNHQQKKQRKRKNKKTKQQPKDNK